MSSPAAGPTLGDRSTAMSRLIICEARMMSHGRLLSTPPSTRRSPPDGTGGRMPGIATLARIAVARCPRSWSSTRDLVRFVDTQKNGSHRSRSSTPANILARLRSMRSPLINATTGTV